MARAVGMNHIAIEVGSLDEALEFYGGLFELELRGRMQGMAFIDMGDQFLALAEQRDRDPDGARHFGLTPEVRASNLSRGERAGLSLALTLAPQPEILILDDPALGLDPVARRSLLESIIQVTRASGRTIFFSSHLLDDVERVADYVAVLDRSVLRALCPIDEVSRHATRFVLSFAGEPPALPSVPGMLTARKFGQALHLIVVRPTDETRHLVRAMGAASVEEQPVGFGDAMIGYLGERGLYRSPLDAAMMSAVEGS